jgi:hypothetical protein
MPSPGRQCRRPVFMLGSHFGMSPPGTSRTFRDVRLESALKGKADMRRRSRSLSDRSPWDSFCKTKEAYVMGGDA